MRDRNEQLDDLRAALRADAAGVAIALLGEPNRSLSTKAKLKWGAKGSLVVEITGSKKGLWFSHEATEGKDLLGLIRQQHGCNFPDAVAWARSHTGLAEPEDEDSEARDRREAHAAERRAQWAKQEALNQAKAEADRSSSIAWVQRVVGETAPIEGTPADYYLRQERGIVRPAGGWPAAVRWHPRLHALVMVATLADGTVQRLQRIHLGSDGAKMDPAELERRRYQAVKQTNGPQAGGAAVRLPGDGAGPLLLAEGPETALAAWTSTGFETWAALGSVGKLELPAGRRIVVLRDDDAQHSPGDGALRRALASWRAAGHDVTVATPWPKRQHDKSDLADVILAHGPGAVRTRVNLALNRSGKVQVNRVTLAEGRAVVDAEVGRFFDRVDATSARKVAWDEQAAAATAGQGGAALIEQDVLPLSPDDEADAWDAALAAPVVEREPDVFTSAIRVDVGVGKSHSARAHIVRVRAAMKVRGDERSIVVLVPAHALGDEQAAAFRAMPEFQAAGLTVATYRGRAAADPSHTDYGDLDVARPDKATMCGDLERVRDAQAIGLNAQTAVCTRTVKQPDGTKAKRFCPLFHVCAYQAQRRVTADIWIAAHDVGFHGKPECMGEAAAVVVDEAAWRKGLIGAEGKPITLSLDSLDHDNEVWSRKLGGVDQERSARLRDLRRQLAATLTGQPDGPFSRNGLVTTLTPESCVEGFGLEFDRLVNSLHPGQSRQERKDAMEAAQANTTVRRLSMLWTAMRVMLSPGAPEASGWLELGSDGTKEGQVRVVRLKGRSEIKDGWKVPTLLMDALLPIDLVQHLWRGAELVADVRVETPHQHVRQVTDKAFSLSMLAPLTVERAQEDPKEAQRRSNRLRDLRAWIVRQARHYAPGKVLVVLQQGVEDALRKAGRLPSNVDTGHHNAIAGRDEWKDVACLIVIGRTLPGPGPIEAIREALTGEAVPTRMDWYHRVDAVREMVDGTSLPAEAECHTDPLAEVIRWQVAEGELVQIIGRGRGTNRTADTPLDVFVLTDAPLPVPLAGVVQAPELVPSVVDLMLAAGGVVLENARHAAAAYPDLWPNHKAAAKAMERERSATFSYRESLIGECRTPRLSYLVKGPGQKAAAAAYDPELCLDPQILLTAALGELTWFWVEGEGEPPEPPKPGRKARPPAPEPEPTADEAGHGDDQDGDGEIPAGHPVLDDVPPDPDWSRMEAGDRSWGEDSEPSCGVERRDAGVAVPRVNPTRAACCEETMRNQPTGVGPDWCEAATADRPIEEVPPDHPAWTNVPSDTGWDGRWTLADERLWAGQGLLERGQGSSVTGMPSGECNPCPAPVPACAPPWLHPDVLASPAPGGRTVLACPFCGEMHRHHGYGRRLAHYDDPQERGYVLRELLPGPAGSSGAAGARARPW